MIKDTLKKCRDCLKCMEPIKYDSEQKLYDYLNNLAKHYDSEELISYSKQYTHYNKTKKVYYINTKKKRNNNDNFVYLLLDIEKKIDIINDNNNTDNINSIIMNNTMNNNTNSKYEYPKETPINYKIDTEEKYGPFGTQSVYDEQVDDEITPEMIE